MAIIFGTSENNNLRGTNVADEISLADGPGSAWSRDGNDNVWATTNGRHTVGTGAGNDTAGLISKKPGLGAGFFIVLIIELVALREAVGREFAGLGAFAEPGVEIGHHRLPAPVFV